MNEILFKSIEQMPGLSFDCSCGRKHSVDINNILIANNVLEKISGILSSYKDKKVFLFSDNNTYAVFGSKVYKYLVNNSFVVKNFIFNTGKTHLIPDEKALGRLLMELDPDTSYIIAVGSGTLNDLARIIAQEQKYLI